MSEIKYTDKKLREVLKAFKGSVPKARVGILGKKATRTRKKSETLTNAEVGAIHEYGAPGRNIPIRSFLRVPINELLPKRIESIGLYDRDEIEKVLAAKSLIPFLKKIAVAAEAIVLEAFQTGGFGRWAPSKEPNKTGLTLVETSQLRRSISYEVK